MALLAFPSMARVTEITHELWSPGRIVHRLRDGGLSPPLDRAEARWRGTFTLGVLGVRGAVGSRDAAELEAFLAQFGDARNHVELPWGGGSDGKFPVPVGWRGVANGGPVGGVVTFTRSHGGSVAVGDWLRVEDGFPHAHRCVLVVTKSGADAMPQLSFVPPLPRLTVTNVLNPATTMAVRMRDPGEQGIPVSRSPSWGGAVTVQWEELV